MGRASYGLDHKNDIKIGQFSVILASETHAICALGKIFSFCEFRFDNPLWPPCAQMHILIFCIFLSDTPCAQIGHVDAPAPSFGFLPPKMCQFCEILQKLHFLCTILTHAGDAQERQNDVTFGQFLTKNRRPHCLRPLAMCQFDVIFGHFLKYFCDQTHNLRRKNIMVFSCFFHLRKKWL